MARPPDDYRLGRLVEDLLVAPVAVVYPHVAHASMTRAAYHNWLRIAAARSRSEEDDAFREMRAFDLPPDPCAVKRNLVSDNPVGRLSRAKAFVR